MRDLVADDDAQLVIVLTHFEHAREDKDVAALKDTGSNAIYMQYRHIQ